VTLRAIHDFETEGRMSAPEFRAALLALPTEWEKLLGKGVAGLSIREIVSLERAREAAAVEAMLVEVAYRIPGEDYSVVELEELRAAYLAARRGE